MHIKIGPGNMKIHIFLLFCTLPALIFSRSITLSHIKKLPLPQGLASPTSISFSPRPSGGGPYIGCSDGRILKYIGKTKSFEAFGYTSPNRNASLCDNTNNVDTMPTCGLPSGLGFHNDGNLYVVDEYYGLTSVAWNGGKATINIPTDGAPPRYPPINLPYALDVDVNGICRFTDASFVVSPRGVVIGVGFPDGDDTGSMYSYDPSQDQLLLMTRDLHAPTGLATDQKAKYILISESESSTKRVVKYWLEGKKSGTIEDIKNFTGIPQDIKRNKEGHFWVANNIINNNDLTVIPQGVKINGNGKVLATVNFSRDYDKPISIVLEYNKKLYVGGYNFTFVGVYRIK